MYPILFQIGHFVEFFRGQPALFAWNSPAAQVYDGLLLLAAAVGSSMLRTPAIHPVSSRKAKS